MIIYLIMAIKITVRRNKPTAATLTNLYDYINKTFQETDLYYTKEQTQELKNNDNFIFLERDRYGK